MKRLKPKLLLSLCWLGLGTALVVATTPLDTFFLPNDQNVSAYGLALSYSHLNPDVPCQGFVRNGAYECYVNWSPWVFRLYAGWFTLTGDTSLANARLLSALIYGLSGLLFFWMLLRHGASLSVSSWATLLYLTLPLHLTFGGLVYANVWLLPFWTLALLVYHPDQPRTLWGFSFVILLGTLFMWFTCFLLPLPWLHHWARRAGAAAWQRMGWGFLAVVILALVSLILLSVAFPEAYRVASLLKWTWWRSEPLPASGIPHLLKVGGILGVEMLSFLLLAWMIRGRNRIKGIPTQGPSHLGALLLGGLLLYVICLPKWFELHLMGVTFFSLALGLGLAAVLQNFDSARPLRRMAGLMVLLHLVLFAGLKVSVAAYTRPQAEAYQALESVLQEAPPSVLFLDVPPTPQYAWLRPMALQTLTQNYVFADPPPSWSIPHWIDRGLARLDQHGYNSVNTEVVWLLTTDSTFTELPVVVRHHVQDFTLYQLRVE